MKAFLLKAWYRLAYTMCWLFCFTFYGFRSQKRNNVPATGGGLICANHQSFFDPVVIALTCYRKMSFVARSTLFDVPVLGPMIMTLGAFPIDREKGGLAGLKKTIRELRDGKLVLIFPEGTRTPDGELQPLKPGFCALVRRCKVPIIPVGFDGPYQAWPRDSKFPRIGTMRSCVGEPITPEQVEQLDDDQLIALVADRMADCFQKARAARELAINGRK